MGKPDDNGSHKGHGRKDIRSREPKKPSGRQYLSEADRLRREEKEAKQDRLSLFSICPKDSYLSWWNKELEKQHGELDAKRRAEKTSGEGYER